MLCTLFTYHVYFRKYRCTKLSPSFWITLYYRRNCASSWLPTRSKDRQCTYNVILRRVRATIVVVEEQPLLNIVIKFMRLGLSCAASKLHVPCAVLYRVIQKSLRNFWTQLHNNQDRHSRKEHINRCRISPSFFLFFVCEVPLRTCKFHR